MLATKPRTVTSGNTKRANKFTMHIKAFSLTAESTFLKLR